MKEIDIMLNQWIYSSIIRAQLRKLIIKAINEKYPQNQNAVNALHSIGGVDGNHINIYLLEKDY